MAGERIFVVDGEPYIGELAMRVLELNNGR